MCKKYLHWSNPMCNAKIYLLRRDKFNLLIHRQIVREIWVDRKIKNLFFSDFWVGKDLKNIFPSFLPTCSRWSKYSSFLLRYVCCLNLEHSIPERTSFRNEYSIQLSDSDRFWKLILLFFRF